MSDNLTIALNEIIKNQKLAKYLYYDVDNPLSKPDLKLPAKQLIKNKVFPYPFDPVATIDDCTELRVYYPETVFDGSGAVGYTKLNFDIVVAKSLWLVNDGKPAVRPYMILDELKKIFESESISTLSRLRFTNFIHLYVNTKFDAIRAEAELTLFGDNSIGH